MSIADKIPGMKSGSTLRNIIILLLYFFLFPLIFISLPIIMGVLVARNYGNWADTFSRLPGISATGGWKSGISAAVYMFGLLLLFGVVTDGSDVNNTDSALEDDTSNTSSDTATSSSSDENEGTTSEPEDSSTEDDGTDSGADIDDPPESSGSDRTDESKTETGTDGTESSEESTTDSTASESDTEDETSGDDSSSAEGTDDESTTSEPSSEAADADEPETIDDSETQSTASVPSEVSGGEARHATVTRVIDGDTMEVQFINGEEDTVRLIGVDTPETTLGNVNPGEYEGIPDTPAARDHLYSWGQQASQYATEELDGQEVRVVIDPEGDRRGSYGRLLAYLYVGEENFNRTLLEGGYARVYDSSFSLREEFDSAEAEARSNKVGLWNFEDDSSSSTATESDSEDTSSSSSDDSGSESDDEVDLPPVPADGDYDCGHFDTQEQAQYVLENTDGDPHRLDADGDGVACETLP